MARANGETYRRRRTGAQAFAGFSLLSRERHTPGWGGRCGALGPAARIRNDIDKRLVSGRLTFPAGYASRGQRGMEMPGARGQRPRGNGRSPAVLPAESGAAFFAYREMAGGFCRRVAAGREVSALCDGWGRYHTQRTDLDQCDCRGRDRKGKSGVTVGRKGGRFAVCERKVRARGFGFAGIATGERTGKSQEPGSQEAFVSRAADCAGQLAGEPWAGESHDGCFGRTVDGSRALVRGERGWSEVGHAQAADGRKYFAASSFAVGVAWRGRI